MHNDFSFLFVVVIVVRNIKAILRIGMQGKLIKKGTRLCLEIIRQNIAL